MSLNKVEIANIALKKIGMNRISGFDDGSEISKTVSTIYDLVLSVMLGAHQWSFAQKEVSLTALDITPEITERALPYVYQIPSDFIKINYVSSGATVVMESDGIHSDFTGLQIIYTYKNDNPLTYSTSFTMALCTRLAHEMAFNFTESEGKSQKLLQQYESLDLPRAIYEDRTQSARMVINQNDWDAYRSISVGDAYIVPPGGGNPWYPINSTW